MTKRNRHCFFSVGWFQLVDDCCVGCPCSYFSSSQSPKAKYSTWELALAQGVPRGKWGRKTKILRLHRLLLLWWSKTPWWARPLPSTSYILLRVGGRLVGVWGQWRPSWSQVCRIQYRYALDNMISGKFNSYGIPESVSVVFQMIHLMKDRGLK